MFRQIYNLVYDAIDYIVFGILLLAAFVILLSGNSPQIRKLQGNITDTFAFLAYPKHLIKKTTGLIQENKKLRRENLRLKQRNSRFIEAYKENQRYEKLLGFTDSIDYEVLPCRVINFNSMAIGKSLMIDAGKVDNVTNNLPVVCTDGVVGKVVSAGETTSTVQIMKDVNYRLSIRFRDSRELGILRSRDNGVLEVREIPSTSVVHPGEEVITSGFSNIYPADLRVGKVKEIRQSKNGRYQIATIESYVDFRSLEEVFVILEYKND